jgi:hypothetical protein
MTIQRISRLAIERSRVESWRSLMEGGAEAGEGEGNVDGTQRFQIVVAPVNRRCRVKDGHLRRRAIDCGKGFGEAVDIEHGTGCGEDVGRTHVDAAGGGGVATGFFP